MGRGKLALVGLFVLVTLALFATGLFLIGERRMLFTDKIELVTEFASVSGLQPGAPVQVSGMSAGDVRAIEVPIRPGGRFRVRFTVREDLQPLVRTDSVATIQTEGLVGGTFLAVAAGTENAPPAVSGTLIPSREPYQLADLLEQLSGTIVLVNETITDLRGDVEQALTAIADTAVHADALIQEVGADIAEITEAGTRVVRDTQAIMADLQAGRGTAGRFLKDDTIYREAEEMMVQARATVTQVREAAAEVRQALGKLNEAEGPTQSLVADLRQTVAHARGALANLEENTEALKRNWFFRGFFRDRGYYNLHGITPAEYRDGALTKGGRRALRIWLDGGMIFERDGSGALQVSAGGRARLDSAMSTFLMYPLDSPLVVEGYATEGMHADRFTAARERAAVARAYLVDRFELDPARIAMMPLVGDASRHPGEDRWNGIALTLFVDEEALQHASERPPALPRGEGAAAGSVETVAPVAPER